MAVVGRFLGDVVSIPPPPPFCMCWNQTSRERGSNPKSPDGAEAGLRRESVEAEC